MAYSIVGLIAIVVHLIVHLDLLFFVKTKSKRRLFYILFLISVIIFHITDGIWGFLDEAKLSNALFIDTTIYFVAMALSILMWGFFVFSYLDSKNNKPVIYVGILVFAAQIILLFINLFQRVLFDVDANCVYTPLTGRYVMLSLQALMYFILSLYSFITSFYTKGSLRFRYISVGFFGLLMMGSIIAQVFFPLLPLYSLGFLLGITGLHTFVVEDEVANRKRELEMTKIEVITDPLTGLLNKHAYIDYEAEIDKKIDKDLIEEFSIVVFDLNDLKGVNDNFGHGAGDEYITKSARMIKELFRGVKVYRVGGDEFALFLEDENYKDREELMNKFDDLINENAKNRNSILIAAGISDYIKGEDTTCMQVFTRADRKMYERKRTLKSHFKK